MAEADRAMMAREVRRLENQINHKQKMIDGYSSEIPRLMDRRDVLLEKIAQDYADTNNAIIERIEAEGEA